MSLKPRVVLGLPLYNNAAYLPQALESLLSQTYRDFAIVATDDGSSDATPEIVRRYAEADERVRLAVNSERLGMVRNWKRSYEFGRELFPRARYFAWGSDHDVWHLRWLEALVERLDSHPEAVLAYPLNVGIDEAGQIMRDSWSFDTAGIQDPVERARRSIADMAAGNMVYGLFRSRALRQCGVYRPVLLPDRLLLAELALHGEFHQVPEVLWFRRYREGVAASTDRQRRSFFPQGAPLYSYLPWSIQHGVFLTWALAVRRRTGAEMSGTSPWSLAGELTTKSASHQVVRSLKRRRKTVLRLRNRILRSLSRDSSSPRRAAVARFLLKGDRTPRGARALLAEIRRPPPKKVPKKAKASAKAKS